MTKVKTVFFCQNCGAQFSKWQGQCTTCKTWNTIAEEVVQKTDKAVWKSSTTSVSRISKPINIREIDTSKEVRLNMYDNEFNRVLGGGLVSGSVTLLGGEPGIGKSTLLLQIALKSAHKVLYVSGEESQKQIKLRAERFTSNASTCYILTETKTQNIFKQIETLKPEVIIIDSIQTLHSDYIEAAAGSISQIKTCTAEFIAFAKDTDTPVILIGHITKDGQIAGPKILEHMVDTVLQFEGDPNYVFRIIRAHKNRFGSTNELGIYEMKNAGLQPITNPSEMLLSERDNILSGHSVAATLEGLRPLMIEVQALVSTAVYGTPQRSTTGFNAKRLNMLLAVLEKRAGFKLATKDVFLNITGGITVNDPAIDLAVVAAILSSNSDMALPNRYCYAAEVGLSGEIRPVQRIEQRILEAEKLGFDKIFISKYSKIQLRTKTLTVVNLSTIEDLVDYMT